MMDAVGQAVPAALDEARTMAAVRRLSPIEDGCLAEIEVTDVGTGHAELAIARLRPGGEASVVLWCRRGFDPLEAKVAGLFADEAPPGWGFVALPEDAGLLALRPGFEEAVSAINDACPSGIARIASEDGWFVALEVRSGAVLLHALEVGGNQPAPHMIDAGALRLGGSREITEMALHQGMLHVAVADATAGFELFRCAITEDGGGLTPVIERGAQRFSLNAAVSALLSTDAGLLIGTAALAGGKERIGNWGPELLMALPDGGWDMIIGQPRFSHDGLKLPASAQLPGLGDTRNAAVKALASGSWAGNAITVMAVQAFAGSPEEDRRKARANLFDYQGELRLFMSSDLATWNVLHHDLGQDIGAVTSLCLTDAGLIVGHEGLGAGSLPVSFVPLR